MTEKGRESEEDTIILSDRCYQSLEHSRNSGTAVRVTFTAIRRWYTQDEKRLRKLLHKFEWEYRLFTEVCFVSDIHFLRLFLCLKLIFPLQLVTMSGASSDQLHRSTLTVYSVSLYHLHLHMISVHVLDTWDVIHNFKWKQELWCTVYLNVAWLELLGWVSIRL